MRGIGGQNRMPNAVEARCRLRQLLMAPAPVLATDARSRAVEDEASRAFLSTSKTLAKETFNALDAQVGSCSASVADFQLMTWVVFVLFFRLLAFYLGAR